MLRRKTGISENMGVGFLKRLTESKTQSCVVQAAQGEPQSGLSICRSILVALRAYLKRLLRNHLSSTLSPSL